MSANFPPEQDPPEKTEGIPWLWLGLGLALTVLGCIGGWFLVSGWLLQAPSPSAALEPTIIILTAPPTPTAAPTDTAAPPTAIPTFTPIPTPDTAVAPENISPDFYAVVANTDNLGLTVRGGPSTRNVVVDTIDEGDLVLILDGPQEADGFVWWQLRLENGLEGWAVANFLEPSAGPE